MWHATNKPRVRRWTKHGVARSSGAVVSRDRIVERTDKGIRSPDRKNSQRNVSGNTASQTGKGGRRANRADLCADDRRPTSIPKEPRGRMLCGVATRAEELRRQRATAAHQQTSDEYLRTLLVQ